MNMTIARPRMRLPARRRFLLLAVGVVLAGLLATVMGQAPRSRADNINGVNVTPNPVEVYIKEGTATTCVVAQRTTFTGDHDAVMKYIDEFTGKARTDEGMTTDVGGSDPAPGFSSYDVTLSYSYDTSSWGAPASNCSKRLAIDQSRGRKTLELPHWARGILAAIAGLTVYVTVSFSVAALFTFLQPEFAYIGDIIAGCLAGFASTIVGNLILGVRFAANLPEAATYCITGAFLNVSLGRWQRQMVSKLRTWLGTTGTGAVQEAVNGSAGTAVQVGDRFHSAATELSDRLASLETP
ncbi:MAG TPA: hypothetical protein VI248_23235 [Kineosporiaceae bacterium]